jgi:hypothetical protein
MKRAGNASRTSVSFTTIGTLPVDALRSPGTVLEIVTMSVNAQLGTMGTESHVVDKLAMLVINDYMEVQKTQEGTRRCARQRPRLLNFTDLFRCDKDG